jgi:hypothetical protein
MKGLLHKADYQTPPFAMYDRRTEYGVLPSRCRLDRHKHDQDMYPLSTRQRRLASVALSARKCSILVEEAHERP